MMIMMMMMMMMMMCSGALRNSHGLCQMHRAAAPADLSSIQACLPTCLRTGMALRNNQETRSRSSPSAGTAHADAPAACLEDPTPWHKAKRPQGHKVARPHGHMATRPQHTTAHNSTPWHKAKRPQGQKATRQQGHKATWPQGHSTPQHTTAHHGTRPKGHKAKRPQLPELCLVVVELYASSFYHHNHLNHCPTQMAGSRYHHHRCHHRCVTAVVCLQCQALVTWHYSSA